MTMSDLISRQTAIDAVGNMLRRKFGIGGDLANITLAGLPTIDAVPVKHGEWIRKSPTAWMWTCSCCKKDDAYAYSAGESFEPDVLQDLFCPNCGAKMDGGKDDE